MREQGRSCLLLANADHGLHVMFSVYRTIAMRRLISPSRDDRSALYGPPRLHQVHDEEDNSIVD